MILRMILRILFLVVVIGLSADAGFLYGVHYGDKHTLDTMRHIGCQDSDVESLETHENS
jgi:hypothetical protein